MIVAALAVVAAGALSPDVLSVAAEMDLHVQSVRFRFTHYDQWGLGYQSAAGPAGQPGSENARIEQPQAEVVARVGERVTQRIWVPLDVVTAASPDHSRFGKPVTVGPDDAISSASRSNVAGSFDSVTSYRRDRATEVFFRAALHLEEPFESWAMGFGVSRALADDNAVLAGSVHQVLDWFDRFDIDGQRHGRASRSTTNANLTLTQLLSPTTILAVSYGGTLQVGTLGNTWTSVLMADGTRGDERLPRRRQRHAVSGRVAQWLPWNGSIKVGYRAYLDGWGAGAHTAEADVTQRLGSWFRVRGAYRWHWQSRVRYFTDAGFPGDSYRTSDSDLASLVARTVGGGVLLDVPLPHWMARGGGIRDVHFDVGYDHYWRTNGLSAAITTCAVGMTF